MNQYFEQIEQYLISIENKTISKQVELDIQSVRDILRELQDRVHRQSMRISQIMKENEELYEEIDEVAGPSKKNHKPGASHDDLL